MPMQPKTEELLYYLLWGCDMLTRPTFQNMTDSFESWAYRNGLHRQLAELERQRFIEESRRQRGRRIGRERLFRLTEGGRLHVLGGRDPDALWQRPWDGTWRLVLFDLPVAENAARDRLRRVLQARHFGCLQRSVWITPDPMAEEKAALLGSEARVKSLVLLEARPAAGEANQDIVAGAWDFQAINQRYAIHAEVLASRPSGRLRTESAASELRAWGRKERSSWQEAVTLDPLLPKVLSPHDYLGEKTWRLRRRVLAEARKQTSSFVPPETSKDVR